MSLTTSLRALPPTPRTAGRSARGWRSRSPRRMPAHRNPRSSCGAHTCTARIKPDRRHSEREERRQRFTLAVRSAPAVHSSSRPSTRSHGQRDLQFAPGSSRNHRRRRASQLPDRRSGPDIAAVALPCPQAWQCACFANSSPTADAAAEISPAELRRSLIVALLQINQDRGGAA